MTEFCDVAKPAFRHSRVSRMLHEDISGKINRLKRLYPRWTPHQYLPGFHIGLRAEIHLFCIGLYDVGLQSSCEHA